MVFFMISRGIEVNIEVNQYKILCDIFGTQPNVCDGAFLGKSLTAFSCLQLSQKSSTIDVRLGFKYHSVHWGIKPPQKHHLISQAHPTPPPTLLNFQIVQATPF